VKVRVSELVCNALKLSASVKVTVSEFVLAALNTAVTVSVIVTDSVTSTSCKVPSKNTIE